MGAAGIEVDWVSHPLVKGYRYGNAPDNSRSYNSREQRPEYGISMAWVEGMADEIGSSMFFSDRKKVELRGYLLPVKGSDGEPIILPVDADNYDI